MLTRRLGAHVLAALFLLPGVVLAQESARGILDDARRTSPLNARSLEDLAVLKKLLADSKTAVRHLDFEVSKNGIVKRTKASPGDILQPGDKKYDSVRAKNERLLEDLTARARRDAKIHDLQPVLDQLPGATDPFLADWFKGVVTSTKGEKMDLADALHYYLKRRLTTKVALDIAEGPVTFAFYEAGGAPPKNTKAGEVWLELGQPFPLIAAKAVELGSLVINSGGTRASQTANALLRALHFLAEKKVPDGLSLIEDPLFSKAEELRSNPDALMSLVEERVGKKLSSRDRTKLEETAFHHYTKHLSDEILSTAPTDGLSKRIVDSMTGKETTAEKIRRIAKARDILSERYGTSASVPTSDLRRILDDALGEAAHPEKAATER